MNTTAAQEARERYAALGEAWLREFDVALIKARTSLSGRASFERRQISAPWPSTTRRRLYILAHEIGHVALGHGRWFPAPAYVREFEAEQFAHALLRRDGIAVPHAETVRAKGYVARKMRPVRSGVDAAIADWADCPSLIPRGRGLPWHAGAMARVAAAIRREQQEREGER